MGRKLDIGAWKSLSSLFLLEQAAFLTYDLSEPGNREKRKMALECIVLFCT